MKLENTQIQMKKGILEFCILSIISRGTTYTSEIFEELTQSRMMVVEGTLYPLLTRLRKAGLLEYQWVESESGPPRKYYLLTADGKRFLKGLNRTWSELHRATQLIVSTTEKQLAV